MALNIAVLIMFSPGGGSSLRLPACSELHTLRLCLFLCAGANPRVRQLTNRLFFQSRLIPAARRLHIPCLPSDAHVPWRPGVARHLKVAFPFIPRVVLDHIHGLQEATDNVFELWGGLASARQVLPAMRHPIPSLFELLATQPS